MIKKENDAQLCPTSLHFTLSLFFKSDLKELMESYQQSMMTMMWHRIVNNLRMNEWSEKEENKKKKRNRHRHTYTTMSINFSQFHQMKWQALRNGMRRNFLLNLSAAKNHFWHWKYFNHLSLSFSRCHHTVWWWSSSEVVFLWCGVCLPKLYWRKLIINEFLPRGLTNFIFSLYVRSMSNIMLIVVDEEIYDDDDGMAWWK